MSQPKKQWLPTAANARSADHLDWTAKQGRIVTGSKRADTLYVPERGFPFSEFELPHFHKMKNTTHSAFKEWKEQGRTSDLVVGAWSRPLFVGGWEHTTDKDETVMNLQTMTLFIDFRIPTKRPNFSGASSLSHLTDIQLRHFARQHVFGGYTLPTISEKNGRPLCTRHHCIDWNFVGAPRSRPNKWYVEIDKTSRNVWKEWSFATDENAQHYYWERWQRYDEDGHFGGQNSNNSPVIALRRSPNNAHKRDGLLIIVGKHFNYLHDRLAVTVPGLSGGNSPTGLVGMVDAAIAQGKRTLAEQYLSIEAGHGIRDSDGKFVIHNDIRPWNEGSVFLDPERDDIQIIDEKVATINGERWDIFESNLSVGALRAMFQARRLGSSKL